MPDIDFISVIILFLYGLIVYFSKTKIIYLINAKELSNRKIIYEEDKEKYRQYKKYGKLPDISKPV